MAKRPTVIGRYQIVDRLGHGGMGSLFRAWDPMLERQIAVKLLRHDDDELRERFAREARSAARLRHRNIVTIFDVGEQDGHPFIAMEYIHGQTLAELIRAGAPISTLRKLQIIDELCDGLAFAHKAGIVHRDVKPPNVMVEHDGTVKILDFGIVRLAESGMTQAGMLIGTVNYMSPEQVAGQPVDLRSDIFAVGAVLYELLSCQQAFHGGLHNGILNRILHEPPHPLLELCPDLDPEIARIVAQALEKDPAARYQDLSVMRNDLQQAEVRLGVAPTDTGRRRMTDAEIANLQAPTAPASRPATPRLGAYWEDLGRRRASQIAAHLEHAQQALAGEEYEVGMAAAEQALLLDAEEPEALDLLERARSALEARRLQELMQRGEERLQAGALTDAGQLADEAVREAPQASAARALQAAVAEARRVRERARERDAAIAAALERARAGLERGALDDAEAAVAEVLGLAPELGEAQALRDQAREARARHAQEAADRGAAAAVEEAEALFATGREGEAIGSLERFKPAHVVVTAALTRLRRENARLEEARRALQERAAKTAATVAAAQCIGSHDAAIRMLMEALILDPEHSELRRLVAERRALQDEERRRARERAEAAVDRARHTASDEEAIRHLQQALEFEPTHATAKQLLQERQARLERERDAARLARQRAEAIAEALAEAQATAAHEKAVAILQRAAALDPSHTAVGEELAARRAALEQERAETRRAQERRSRVDAALATAARAKSHEAAIETLEAAVRRDPGDAQLEGVLARHRAEHDEEIRRAEERRQRVADALEQAAVTPAHDAAIEILHGALALEPSNADVRRRLRERRLALDAERDAVQQAQAREARITAALTRAAAIASHERSVAILERAIAADADPRLQTLLTDRIAARDREREERRQRTERENNVAAAVKQAKRTPSHEAALAILADALALEPDHHDAIALQTARKAGLERQRAEEKRLAEIASVRQTIGDLLDRQQFDAAAAAIHQAKATLQAGKALNDLARRLTRTRATTQVTAQRRQLLARGAAIAARLRVRPALPLLVAAAFLLLTIGGWLVATRGRSPAEGQSSSILPPAVMPPTPATQDQRDPLGTDRPPDTPAESPITELTIAIQKSQQHIARGELRQALTTVTAGLEVEPENEDFRGLLNEIFTKLRQQALGARTSAARHADAATLSAFREGESKLRESATLQRAARHEQAATLLWQAAALFGRAELEAADALARAATASPETPGTRDQLRPEPAPPPSTTGETGPSKGTPADHDEIRGTLRAYEQAYTSGDVDAIARLYPSKAPEIISGMRRLRVHQIKIQSSQISVAENTATVVCTMYHLFQQKSGSKSEFTTQSEFVLEKVAGRWIIVGRR